MPSLCQNDPFVQKCEVSLLSVSLIKTVSLENNSIFKVLIQTLFLQVVVILWIVLLFLPLPAAVDYLLAITIIITNYKC